MHSMKPARARRARLLVPSALAVVILSGAAAPAGAVESDHGVAHPRRAAAAGPVDDLVKGILDAIKALLPPGVSLPDIKIPEIKLPEIKLPEIPGINLPAIPGVVLPAIPGVEIPGIPGIEPPTLPDPASPVVPEVPDVEVPAIPDPLSDLP
ncbi:hypothetical protein OG239_19675 [Streptomyces sp. NBC_00868]|uniref:hypothetical protein n=1 Tax=unclassified Streptomyces TaxID=2593676 RepID=UPI0032502BA8|nr:hypothetical protein OG239_19675 [Streptomyces sp. NBC_00868]